MTTDLKIQREIISKNMFITHFAFVLLSQPWNAHGFYDVRKTEIRTAEPLVPGPSAADVEMAM
jgi:hypothetical protein